VLASHSNGLQDLNHQPSAFALPGIFQCSARVRNHQLSAFALSGSVSNRTGTIQCKLLASHSSRFEPPVERIRSPWFSQQPYRHDTSMIINIATFSQSVRFFEWHFIQWSVCFHFQLLPVGVRLILITGIISLQDFQPHEHVKATQHFG
jgi:hypothetical protein